MPVVDLRLESSNRAFELDLALRSAFDLGPSASQIALGFGQPAVPISDLPPRVSELPAEPFGLGVVGREALSVRALALCLARPLPRPTHLRRCRLGLVGRRPDWLDGHRLG